MKEKHLSNHCWNILVFIRDNTKDESIKKEANLLLNALNTASGRRTMPECRSFCKQHGFSPED